jgi:hypothetical protein
MSIFDKLEVVVRYAVYPADIMPLGRQPAGSDIIDENGRPVFIDAAPLDRVTIEFGSRDVAVLLARDHGVGLVLVRVQAAEAASADAAGVS